LPASYAGSFEALNLSANGPQVGLPNSTSTINDGSHQIIIGKIVIGQNLLGAASDAYIKQSWDRADAGGYIPGLTPSDIGLHARATSALNKIQAATSIFTFGSSVYHMQTVGQVDVIYNPIQSTYSYRVLRNTSSSSGWMPKAVYQNDPLFQSIQLGIYHARH